MGARVDPNQSRLDFALDLGSNHETPYGLTAITMTGMMNCYKFEEMVYCLSSETSYQVSLEQVCYSAYEMEQLELGRTQNEIMDNDFVDWQVLEGHAIP